ncbi:hypothetical protein GCM10022378_19560 [Salinicoccus jeotgali]|uniref:Uncharacterized protein n=1 Tax=Salinicoccus jeotgali TaxID=381634 RepID=A0ABP7F4L3_9STAP
MYASRKTIREIERDLAHLSENHPILYHRLEHVTSFARQLQVKYKYLADMMTGEAHEPTPKFIKSSVLDILAEEVEKLRRVEGFELFLDILKQNRHIDSPEIFLMILGAKPEKVVNNAIIS